MDPSPLRGLFSPIPDFMSHFFFFDSVPYFFALLEPQARFGDKPV